MEASPRVLPVGETTTKSAHAPQIKHREPPHFLEAT